MIGLGLSLWQNTAALSGGATPTVLADNFNDNSRNTSLWNLGAMQDGFSTSTGTINEANARLEVTPAVSTIGYGGYITANTWDLTNSAVYVNISNVGAFPGNEYGYIAVGADADNYYTFIVGAGSLTLARSRFAGSNNNIHLVAYDATNHAWLRISHQTSDNTIHFATAPTTASNPPISADWTDFTFETKNAAITITAVMIALGAGSPTGEGSPVMARFDGFNGAT